MKCLFGICWRLDYSLCFEDSNCRLENDLNMSSKPCSYFYRVVRSRPVGNHGGPYV